MNIVETKLWAIATPTKKGGWRRVPDTKFNDQDSAHAYGTKYHTSKIFGPQYKVISHPDNLKQKSVSEMKTVTNRSHAAKNTIKIGSKEHSFKSYSYGAHHPTFGPLKDKLFKTKSEMKDAMMKHPTYNDSLIEEDMINEVSRKTLKSYLVKKKRATGKDYTSPSSFRKSIEGPGIAQAKLGKTPKRRILPDVKVMATEESINEEMVEAPHGDPHYHANVHRELINRASGPQKEISLGAHIYRHLSTHPDESHIASHYEKTIYPILKKHGFPREDHGPVGPGHPRHDEHLRFHREFLPDVHKAWREMDKNNPNTAKLLSIADKEAKRKIVEREAEKEAKRQKGIEANKKRMNKESINEAAKPGNESKISSFKDFLMLEYLTDDQRKRYADVEMTDKARSDTDHFFGKGNDEKREEIPGEKDDNKSEIHKAVERHIGHPITKDEYHAGKISDKYGRETKLSKSIKDPKLQNSFNSDTTRSGAKKGTSGHYSTVVRGTEVAGQTNSAPDKLHPKGHSWEGQSCKNVDTGSMNHALTSEIQHGSVVHRVHDENGKEIYRATLHPHHNKKGQVAYAVDSEYGIKHPAYTAQAHDIAKRLSDPNGDKTSVYTKHENVYNDSGKETMLHPGATSEHIDRALQSFDPKTRIAATQSAGFSSKHLDKALKDSNHDVRAAVAAHPNATSEHLNKALEDKSENVARTALFNPNITKEHIDKALKHPSGYVRAAAAAHPKATEEHIDKGLDDKDIYTRISAARNRNATSANIHKALKSDDIPVRSQAAAHPNATSEHLHKALDDKSATVRFNALSNTNAKPEHIQKAIHDSEPSIVKHAKSLHGLAEAKEVWDTPSPNKTSKHLSPQKKAMAKARAKAAGRPYPNLIDNLAVANEAFTHTITPTNPGGKTRFAVRRVHKTTKQQIGKPVIYDTEAAAQRHVARATMKEEVVAPANNVGSGNIKGTGGAGGEPGVRPKAMSKYKRANIEQEKEITKSMGPMIAPMATRKSLSQFKTGK